MVQLWLLLRLRPGVWCGRTVRFSVGWSVATTPRARGGRDVVPSCWQRAGPIGLASDTISVNRNVTMPVGQSTRFTMSGSHQHPRTTTPTPTPRRRRINPRRGRLDPSPTHTTAPQSIRDRHRIRQAETRNGTTARTRRSRTVAGFELGDAGGQPPVSPRTRGKPSCLQTTPSQAAR